MADSMSEFDEAAKIVTQKAQAVLDDTTLRPTQAWPTLSGGYFSDYLGGNGARIGISQDQLGQITRVVAEHPYPLPGSREESVVVLAQLVDEASLERGVNLERSSKSTPFRRPHAESVPLASSVGSHFDTALGAVRRIRGTR